MIKMSSDVESLKDDVNAGVDVAEVAEVDAPPKRGRGRPPKNVAKKRKSSYARHERTGDRKNSKTHHLPPVHEVAPTPRAATKAPTSDPRVFNLQRCNKRVIERLRKTESQRDEYAAQNEELEERIKSVEENADERIQTAIKQNEHATKLRFQEADRIEARATRRLENAANVAQRADTIRKRANAKAAKAVAESNELKGAKKDVVKEKVAVTRERKNINANAGAKANAFKRTINSLEEKVERLESELSNAKKELATAKKMEAKAKEKALKDAATIRSVEEVIEDYEKKIQNMLDLAEAQKEAGRIVVKKESVKGSGLKKWSNNMVQLIMEYLVAGGPPSAFSKILVSTLRLMHPDSESVEIEELPGVWFVRRCRTVLLIVEQLFSAYRLAKEEKWGQLNCDATQRHQSSYLNLVLSCVEEFNEDLPPEQQEYVSILMSACIIAEDESAEAQKEAIIEFLNDKNEWLDEWAALVEEKYPDFQHDIKRGGLDLSKLYDGIVTQDTCNTASKGSKLIVNEIKEAAVTAGMNPDDINTFNTYCHHHLRNIWWKWLEASLSKYLRDALQGSLKEIDPSLRVSTNISDIIRAVDKEFSLPANYPKGHGKAFLHWLQKYHPGAILLPTERATGARHDLNVEGAGAIYYNAHLYIQFLDEQLATPNASNILQENLFIILSSSEMLSLCRLCSIFHFAFSLPLRWLAAQTSKLAEHNWSVISMSRALNLFEKAMEKIVSDGGFILSEDWVMNVFDELADEIPKFRKYLTEIFDLEHSDDRRTKVPQGAILRKELFSPEREENIETSEFVKTLAPIAAEAVLKELHDPKKHTWEHLDSQDGPLSWKNATEAMKKASLGKEAVNDVSERPFGGMTHQLERFTTVSGSNASAVAHARINGDFNRMESELCKNKKDIVKNGFAINLQPQLLQTAITFALKKTKEVRQKDQQSLKKQQEQRAAKEKAAKLKGIEKATQELIDCLYYHDMYHSLRRWKTPEEVDEMLKKLSSKTAKLNEIKEQIRIRVLGLGWADLHHPWSKDGKAYSWKELATHLKEKIMPQEEEREIPTQPPLLAPERKKLAVLGTLSANVKRLDANSREQAEEIREKAEQLRDERELEGIGDRYGEMQPLVCPEVKDLLERRLEICEAHGEGEQRQLFWHSGKVTAILKKDTILFQFDDDALDEGEEPIQQIKLVKTFWNKTKHTVTGKGWRLAKEEIELARSD